MIIVLSTCCKFSSLNVLRDLFFVTFIGVLSFFRVVFKFDLNRDFLIKI